MEIRLSPELEAVIEQDVATGRYANAEEYVAEAVERLHEQEHWFEATLEQQRAKLERSIQQAERGELYTEEEVREHMKTVKANWAARKRSA